MKALWRGTCEICDREYGTGSDIVQRGSRYVHTHCVSGGDE